jgi:hypothetical protein
MNKIRVINEINNRLKNTNKTNGDLIKKKV